MANGKNGNGGTDTKAALFAAAYVKHNCNGVRALRSTGHKGSPAVLAQTASRMLRDHKVLDALDQYRHEAGMGAIEAIQRLADIGRFSLDYVLDKAGDFDIRKARKLGKIHLLKSITKTVTDGDGWSKTQYKTEAYSVLDALRLVLQFHGLLDNELKHRRPRDPRELDEMLHTELLRVHGTEEGTKRSLALGLKVAAGIH